MGKKYLFLLIVFVSLSINAQVDKRQWSPDQGAILDGKTILKANLLGTPLRNYGFYAERVLGKRVSFVIGVNKMPTGKIPYLDLFIDNERITDLEVSSFAIMPEIRFYLSKSGYGKGFYIAPYYKYEQFNADNYSVEFSDENSITQTVTLNGNLNTQGAGAIIGVQWLLGKRKNITIDWGIVGAHYGINRGDFDGKSSYSLSEKDQKEVKRVIEEEFSDISISDIFSVKIESVDIDANSAKAKISSPWAFIRSNLSVGIRF